MDEEEREGIGSVIRALREAKGLSRQDLSEATIRAGTGRPVSAEMIAKIEQGRKGPSVESLRGLAAALNLPVEDLSQRGAAWTIGLTQKIPEHSLRLGAISGGITAIALATIGAPLGGVGAVTGAALTARSQHLKRKRIELLLRHHLNEIEELSDQELDDLESKLGSGD